MFGACVVCCLCGWMCIGLCLLYVLSLSGACLLHELVRFVCCVGVCLGVLVGVLVCLSSAGHVLNGGVVAAGALPLLLCCSSMIPCLLFCLTVVDVVGVGECLSVLVCALVCFSWAWLVLKREATALAAALPLLLCCSFIFPCIIFVLLL